MIHSRSFSARMGSSNRRMFSRRTAAGLVMGILLGFNLASWIAIPVPNHTDIEIEVIARKNGAGHRERDNDFADFRLGAARMRRKNGGGSIKTGPDCDHEIVDYSDGEKDYDDQKRQPLEERGKIRQNQAQKEQDSLRDKSEEDDKFDTPDEFDLQEERLKRQKELEVFYESDIETEDDGESPREEERLEDFQYPANVQKYVDYDANTDGKLYNDGLGENTVKGPVDTNRKHKVAQVLEKNRRDRTASDRNHFMYVGVLTAQKYLATRGRAIMNTWADGIPGKVEFYVGEGVENIDDGEKPLPLVELHTVKDDMYPPQKKSFLLLKRMYDAYLNSGYQWFMRADDDVYIKADKLEVFLRKLNSSMPIFLGQTGLGNAEERGRLSLQHGDNYCMGGPGMIFSREVLRRVGPHIRECVRNLYSWHEDVELSRCVRRFADVNCAWSYQMQELFYEHYSLRKGYIDPYFEPNNLKLYSAMTLHPNKNPEYQVKMHKFMSSQKIEERLTRIKELSREVVNADRYLERTPSMEEYMLGIAPTLNRFASKKREDVQHWDFMTDRLWYAAPPESVRRSISTDRQITIRNIIMRVMQAMNSNSKSRGRVIEFNQVAYGYRRVNPLYGAEYVLDLLLTYKRYKGKKMTIPVRRHAYLQQTFTRTVLHEDTPLDPDFIREALKSSQKGVMSSIISSMLKHSMGFMSAVGLVSDKKTKLGLDDVGADTNRSVPRPNVLRIDSGKFTSYTGDVTNNDVPTVHIIIPLKGRFETFRSFMKNLEEVSLLRGDPVSLLVILFTSSEPLMKEETLRTVSLLDTYVERYPQYDLRQIPINGAFSRGLGLEIGASHFSNDSLLFFCDIDVVFDTTFTRKCRANAKMGQRVYYPILFSEFHPDFQRVWSAQRTSSGKPPTVLQDPATVRKLQLQKHHFNISGTTGYWRNYGYGLLCTYKNDFAATGGFDISIQGWGMEDVDLVDKYATGSKSHQDGKAGDVNSVPSKNRVSVFRTPDPTLVHVYHPSQCDPNLTENQLRMCRASRASGISSIHHLAEVWETYASDHSLRAVQDPVSGIVPVHPSDEHDRREHKHSEDQSFNERNVVGKPADTALRDERHVQAERTSRLKRNLDKKAHDIS